MRPWEEEVEIELKDGTKRTVIRKGLNYKEIFDWINEHSNGKVNIPY